MNPNDETKTQEAKDGPGGAAGDCPDESAVGNGDTVRGRAGESGAGIFEVSRPKLPDHIGGYQHLQPDVYARADDIFVLRGKPVGFVGDHLGVKELEWVHVPFRVYRHMPVTKQGDNDETRWKAVQDSITQKDRGNAPLPLDAKARKRIPIGTGFCDYFPRAMAAVAAVSLAGNKQHHPSKPLHWDKHKSRDHADALMRHFLERTKIDTDGQPHAAKMAWRAMALLEEWLEGRP